MLLGVPHAEIERRQKEYQELQNPKRRGPKPTKGFKAMHAIASH